MQDMYLGFSNGSSNDFLKCSSVGWRTVEEREGVPEHTQCFNVTEAELPDIFMKYNNSFQMSLFY